MGKRLACLALVLVACGRPPYMVPASRDELDAVLAAERAATTAAAVERHRRPMSAPAEREKQRAFVPSGPCDYEDGDVPCWCVEGTLGGPGGCADADEWANDVAVFGPPRAPGEGIRSAAIHWRPIQ